MKETTWLKLYRCIFIVIELVGGLLIKWEAGEESSGYSILQIAGAGIMLIGILYEFIYMRCPYCGEHISNKYLGKDSHCEKCGKKFNS